MTKYAQVTVTLPAPPEGMEWHGTSEAKENSERLQVRVWELRPIGPQYVYPKVRREDAEYLVRTHGGSLAAAMREALEAKGEPQFDPAKHSADIAKSMEAKPGPVCGKHHHNGQTCPSKHCGGGASLPCQLPVNHEGPHA